MEPPFPLNFTFPKRGSGDLMRALLRQLVAAIGDGRLQPGLQLPATRELARQTGVARNTVLSAYQALIAQGLAISRHGSGTFVNPSLSRAPDESHRRAAREPDQRLNAFYHGRYAERATIAQEGTYDFRVGIPDWRHLSSWEAWRRLSARALRTPRPDMTSYIDSTGPRSLREAISAQVSFTRAISCDPGNIVITAGAQQAFDLLARILVTRPGAAVAVEDPGYPRSRDAFVAAGASIVPIEVDEHGMRVETIASSVRVISTTPSHQYPLGSQMSEHRRHELLQFAQEHDSVIVEDDYDGEFRFEGRSLDALKALDRNDRVFYVGTFSKSLFPSLRLGYVVAPAWARDALAYAKQCADLHSSGHQQRVLTAFIKEGYMARHLKAMRRIYQARAEQLVASLHEHCGSSAVPFAPAGGLHLVVLLPAGADPKAIAARCDEGGVAVSELSELWVHQPRWPMLGLGFGMIPEDQIDAGVHRFNELAFPKSAGR